MKRHLRSVTPFWKGRGAIPAMLTGVAGHKARFDARYETQHGLTHVQFAFQEP